MGTMGMCERKQEREGDGWKRTESGKSLDEQIYQTHLPPGAEVIYKLLAATMVWLHLLGNKVRCNPSKV